MDANDANPGSTASGAGGIDWDALIAAATEDPGAAFAPDVVRELVQLKRANRARFETLRTQLKKAGCRVTELDALIAKESGEKRDGRPPAQADLLVALAEAAELFHTPDDVAYADIEVNWHRETWPVRSYGFRRWLKRRFFEEFDKAPNGEAVAAAIGVIEAKAQHDTPVRDVFVRVGELDSKVYLDLCNPDRGAVEADQAGWRVVDRPVIRFRRSPDMRALPTPETDGSVDGLQPLLNIAPDPKNDDDFILAIAYLLACLRGRGPYPVMAIGGEQGTAKSTRSAMLRSVIDPRKPALRALPRDERDLVVAARNQHVLAFDNVSYLRTWLSDALCRIASGAGFGTRELYTDQEEVVFSGARPLILNGIEEIIDRPDLAERAIFSLCELIDSKNRLSEEEVWAAFDAAHASVLGALLDAVVTGLRHFSAIRPPDLPRMADFAHWAIACEPALWKGGDFLRAYNANILGAVESVLEASQVAVAVREMMANLAKEAPPKTKWAGTAAELLTKLTNLVSDRISNSKTWPVNGRALSDRLRRTASFLRRVGINIVFERDAQARRIVITMDTPAPGAANKGGFASSPSSPSSAGTASRKNNDLDGGTAGAKQAGDDAKPAGDDAKQSRRVEGVGPAVSLGAHANPLKTNDARSGAGPDDANDDSDAKAPTSMPPEGGISEQREHKGPRHRTTRALDLYCCAGGATRGLQQAGLYVVGIDHKHQPNYRGDAFVRADALEYLESADLSQFDFIWASPPCQGFTRLRHAPGTKAHPDLITPTRALLVRSGKPYCIENVVGAPLVNPTTLCGTMFGLQTPDGAELWRHRLFETSFPLLAPPCQHRRRPVVIGVCGSHFRDRRRAAGANHRSGSNLPRQQGFIAMGIDWPMTTDEISEAIPPAFSHFIAEQWLKQTAVT